VQALPSAAFFLFLEAATGGTIALFWVHLRNEVSRGFTLFTGACFAILGGLAIWLRFVFPPASAIDVSATARLWFAVERTLSLAFVCLLVVYLILVGWQPARRNAAGLSDGSLKRNGRVREGADEGRAAGLVRLLGPLVPLLGLGALWSAALVDASPQLFGLGAPLAVLLGGLALGSALAGLSLGHWYLVSPALSLQPLIRLTFLCLGAIVGQIILLPILVLVPGPRPGALQTLLGEYLVFLGVRVVFGLLVPLGATLMTWRTARIRSLDSATGLLYIVAALVLAGEIAARTLYFLTGIAT
jgi:hypothetical protein